MSDQQPLSLLGPGLTHTAKLTGIDQLTIGKLRQFLDSLGDVPDNAPIDLEQDHPDRPGERTLWTIEVSWRPVTEDG